MEHLDDPDGFRGIELIYYGQMGLVAEADALLARQGYGRAHFRALYVIGRNPGINGNELLAKLKITNQSLSRVLRQLLADGLVAQQLDRADRRQRNHSLKAAGVALEEKVRGLQRKALHAAYAAAGPQAVGGFLLVLEALVLTEDRPLLTGSTVAPGQ